MSPQKKLTTSCIGDALPDHELLYELDNSIYDKLRKRAAQIMRGERKGHTLQATAIVHEAWLELVGSNTLTINDRNHFLNLVTGIMRRRLVEYARARNAEKRGGEYQRVTLTDGYEVVDEGESLDVINLDEALKEFESVDPRGSMVVHYRYFGGLTIKETAQVLGVSVETVKSDWSYAKGWLFEKLRSG
jgi:RNA polymerase sigma factor (TIGR02999 family)